MTILLTGGAGYIGSHTSHQLVAAGHKLIVIDNLSTGFQSAVPKEAVFYNLDLNQREELEAIFQEHQPEAVMHFAASVVVPESVANPAKYYLNNTLNTLGLVEICQKFKTKYFVFSSTAAVYGEPKEICVSETSPLLPINPYGHSKLFSEQMIQDYAKINSNFKFAILRYFNVAGASPSGKIGQSTKNATHLVKVAAEHACNKRSEVQIFGTNLDSIDGSCVRDYIHVEDLASAHLAALEYLANTGKSDIFNCGYGRGYSVRQVLDCMAKVSNKTFHLVEKAQRPGDPVSLTANNQKILQNLNWKPKFADLELICKTAYEWEKKLT